MGELELEERVESVDGRERENNGQNVEELEVVEEPDAEETMISITNSDIKEKETEPERNNEENINNLRIENKRFLSLIDNLNIVVQTKHEQIQAFEKELNAVKENNKGLLLKNECLANENESLLKEKETLVKKGERYGKGIK